MPKAPSAGRRPGCASTAAARPHQPPPHRSFRSRQRQRGANSWRPLPVTLATATESMPHQEAPIQERGDQEFSSAALFRRESTAWTRPWWALRYLQRTRTEEPIRLLSVQVSGIGGQIQVCHSEVPPALHIPLPTRRCRIAAGCVCAPNIGLSRTHIRPTQQPIGPPIECEKSIE
jgi:hypothetical protein